MPTMNDETLQDRYARETAGDFQRMEREIERLRQALRWEEDKNNFDAKRLRRLALLFGIAVPIADETLIGCAGTVLGQACAVAERIIGMVPVAYANRDELDNMLDDRTATVAGVKDGWRTTALYAAPVAPTVPQWQPIDTAPKDGTKILGYRDGDVAVAYVTPRDDCEMWSFGGSSGSTEFFPYIKPTHWMPLPAAPEYKEGE